MIFSLTEIQITMVILMSLFALVIAFIVPHYTKKLRIFVVTRRLILAGTILASLHFLVQYILHKNFIPEPSLRTLINILFGFPTSYFFTLSLQFIIQRGHIKRFEWLFVPSLYIIALLILVVSLVLGVGISSILPSIAFIYAIELMYCSMLLIRNFFRMRTAALSGDHSYALLLKWTQWSLFLMPAVGLGFPFVIFSSNVMVRSVYGIITLSVVFIFVLGLLGYVLSYNVMASLREKQEIENASVPDNLFFNNGKGNQVTKNIVTSQYAAANDAKSDRSAEDNDESDDFHSPAITIDDARMARITEATQKFIEERKFAVSGLSLKDAASEMKVPVHLLRLWLRTTKYEKYNNWIIQLRIEYAKQLLSDNPSLTNEVVAEKCGFCDRQYFQTQFTKYVGVTPFKWIKGIQTDEQ